MWKVSCVHEEKKKVGKKKSKSGTKKTPIPRENWPIFALNGELRNSVKWSRMEGFFGDWGFKTLNYVCWECEYLPLERRKAHTPTNFIPIWPASALNVPKLISKIHLDVGTNCSWTQKGSQGEQAWGSSQTRSAQRGNSYFGVFFFLTANLSSVALR